MAFTSSYVMRCAVLMTVSEKRCAMTFPFFPISMKQEIVSFSVPSVSEHTPLLTSGGNIGSTRSGKYTLVPRL